MRGGGTIQIILRDTESRLVSGPRNGRVRQRSFRGIERAPKVLRALAACACLAVIGNLLAGCERQPASSIAGDKAGSVSKDRIWSYMINDSMPDARIRKWSKPALRGLMIVDQSRATFYDQFAPLIRDVGEGIGIDIDVCAAIMRRDVEAPPSVSGCEGTSFDFHFVITDGAWTEPEWQAADRALHGQSRELLAEVRYLLATEAAGKTCRYTVRTSHQVANQIELAVAVIDTNLRIALGTCGTYTFLHMLGLFAFDKPEPLDPMEEAGSMAAFLLKETPYGGEYLLRLLYSPAVPPGMAKEDFLRTLPQ